MSLAELRAYGGEDGETRIARRRRLIVDAALDMLTEPDGGAVTVRGICQRAGLTPRYFYESFAGVDALVEATYDEVIGEIADLGLAALERGAGPSDRVASAVDAIIEVIDSDRRKGVLLFADTPRSPVLAVKRAESVVLLATLTSRSATDLLGLEPGPETTAAAHFQVGGLGRLLASWTGGLIDLDREQLTRICVKLLLPADGAG